MRKQHERDRGVVAVEFALILPIFLLLILGTLEVTLALRAQMSLDAAVRAGAREFAITGNEAAATATMARTAPTLDLEGSADITFVGCTPTELPDPDAAPPATVGAPDGGTILVHPDGAVTVSYPDGSEILIAADGATQATTFTEEGDPETVITDPTRTPPAPADTGLRGDAVVHIDYTHTPLTGVLGLELSMGSQAVMRCGG